MESILSGKPLSWYIYSHEPPPHKGWEVLPCGLEAMHPNHFGASSSLIVGFICFYLVTRLARVTLE